MNPFVQWGQWDLNPSIKWDQLLPLINKTESIFRDNLMQ